LVRRPLQRRADGNGLRGTLPGCFGHTEAERICLTVPNLGTP
jgi:hypothetical protein